MNNIKQLKCTLCNESYTDDSLYTCPTCGEKGILEVEYNYHQIKPLLTKEILQKDTRNNIFRYSPLLPITHVPSNTLQVGWTPFYKSSNMGAFLKMKNLYFKDDGLNPTSSLKDRASVIACVKAIEKDKQIIACSSTGNAASSLAGNAARLGLQTVIFVPERAPIGKLLQMLAYGANVIKIKGDYKDAFEASKSVINKYNLYNRNAAINPYLVEGKKTVALEIAEQHKFEPIDNIFVSVGDGCTIYSVYKGFYDLNQIGLINYMPTIYGIQAEGCAPFYTAWKNNTPLKETDEKTIADSIAVGIPRWPVKGLKAVTETTGEFITVTDQEILQASYQLAKQEGIFCEPAAAAGVAGLIKAVQSDIIQIDDTTVVIITGNGLKDANAINNIITPAIHISKNELLQKIQKSQNTPSITHIIQGIQKEEVNYNE